MINLKIIMTIFLLSSCSNNLTEYQHREEHKAKIKNEFKDLYKELDQEVK
jgi:PBP1b-binding outer membrane lipoprotein LpoB